jgi:hypothetical protein
MLSKLSDALQSRRLDGCWLLVVVFTFIVAAPLTYPGTLQAHSGFLPLFNLYDLETHGFSLTWAPVVGREFDLLRGEGGFPYLLAEALRWLRASGVTAVKAVFGLGLFLGALGTYGWARQLLSRRAALLAALLYACGPFGLATLYLRGALAETLFLGLLPWSLWALQRTLDGHRWGPAALALGVALLIWTQAGLGLWAVAALLAYGLAAHTRRWPATTAGLLGGLLLGAIGLWPLAAGRGIGGSPTPFVEHFVYPFQLLSGAWGRGVSVAGWQDDFPMQIGLVAAGLALLALSWLVAVPKGQRQAAKARVLWTCAGLSLALIFLTLTWAAPLWRLPGLVQASSALTTPWQLLGLLGPFLALLGGSAVALGLERLPERRALPLWAGMMALTLLSSTPYLQPLTTRYEPAAAPLAVLGDNELLLLDAQVEGALRPGGKVQLAVRWQPLRPLAQDYTVFVHALDESDRRWGQQDTQPQSGEYPTSSWQVGEIVEDDYELDLAADGPVEGYHLTLGLYEWQTGQRMRVGEDDKVIIREIP